MRRLRALQGPATRGAARCVRRRRDRRMLSRDCCRLLLPTNLPTYLPTGAWAGSVTRPAEAESPLLFFARVTAALRMGRRFSVQRVLELRQADLAIT